MHEGADISGTVMSTAQVWSGCIVCVYGMVYNGYIVYKVYGGYIVLQWLVCTAFCTCRGFLTTLPWWEWQLRASPGCVTTAWSIGELIHIQPIMFAVCCWCSALYALPVCVGSYGDLWRRVSSSIHMITNVRW